MKGKQLRVDLSTLNISIVGLGLMGGSLALALRGRAGKIIGVDGDDETRNMAIQLDAVNTVTSQLRDGIAAADLVVLAVPVESIVSIVRELPELRPDGCMVMDLGSTKGEIGRAMELLPSHFPAIGGHPMCGREQSGLRAAAADLYQDQTFILCRNQRTTDGLEEIALAMVREIGSRPLIMQADTHDELVAASSHLPYVVASVLMGRAWDQARDDQRLWQVSASGLRDTTRLAGSGPQMMLEILMSNSEPIVKQIETYGEELAALAKALSQGDREALRFRLETAKQQRLEYMKKKDTPGNVSGR